MAQRGFKGRRPGYRLPPGVKMPKEMKRFTSGFTPYRKKFPGKGIIVIYQIGIENQIGITNALENRLKTDKSIMSAAVQAVSDKLAENFATQGRSQGKEWKKIKKATMIRRNKTGYSSNTAPLIRSGALEQAISRSGMDYNIERGGLSKTYGPNPAIVRRKISASGKEIDPSMSDNSDKVSVKFTTRLNDMTGDRHTQMTIRGPAVANNDGGTTNGKKAPARPIWFMNANIEKHAMQRVGMVLQGIVDGTSTALKTSVLSPKKISFASQKAFSIDRSSMEKASKDALRIINARIDEEIYRSGARGRVTLRGVQEHARRKQIEDPYRLLDIAGVATFSDVVRILRHKSGIKMSMRYRTSENVSAPLYHTSGELLIAKKVSKKGYTGRQLKSVQIKTPRVTVTLSEENLDALNRYMEDRALARRRASVERRNREIRALNEQKGPGEIMTPLIPMPTVSPRTKKITAQGLKKMEVRAYTLLAREVEYTRAYKLPYKRSWRRAIANYVEIHPSKYMPFLIPGQQKDAEGIMKYSARHISSLSGKVYQPGQSIAEQLAYMRGEIAEIERRYGGREQVESIPYRYAANTTEGYQERLLAELGPSGKIIVNRQGQFFRTRRRNVRTTLYAGDLENITLRRHNIVTNLLESGTRTEVRNKQGEIVGYTPNRSLEVLAQELLSHVQGTRLIRQVYGRYAFKDTSIEDNTTMRVSISALRGRNGEEVPFEQWSREELDRNRYHQLLTSLAIAEDFINAAFEDTYYVTIDNFIRNSIGMYRPNQKDRSTFMALDDVKNIIMEYERDFESQLSSIFGRPMVGPRYFSRRRTEQWTADYDSPDNILSSLGLSDRPSVPTVNKRFRVNRFGQMVGVTRERFMFYNRDANALATDEDTARRVGLLDYEDFTPDVKAFGALNERWFAAARNIIETHDEMSKLDAADAWRAAFTPPSTRTGAYQKNWWQWHITGIKPGQAYYGSDLLAPVGELSVHTHAASLRKTKANAIIRAIAEIEREAPELFEILTPSDRQSIRGLRETRLWVSGLEKRNKNEEEDANIFMRVTMTEKERKRRNIK